MNETNKMEKPVDDEDDSVNTDENCLPLKLFDGKKQSISEHTEESKFYMWLLRIKEIFLHMGQIDSGGYDDEAFVRFDMQLARNDLTNICDRYIENERPKIIKKEISEETTNTIVDGSPIWAIRDTLKELNLILSKIDSSISSDSLMETLTTVNAITKMLQQHTDRLQHSDKTSTKKKSDLEIQQDWNLKKLYADVFKMSYNRSLSKTVADLDDLMPVKRGDEQPNFASPIWWYSCDKASIYYQINSILRLGNFELLFSYRYYLSDLCQMIERMYQKEKQKRIQQGRIDPFLLYRAGNIHENQLDTIRHAQTKQFISLPGFISTTTDMQIAKGYAQKQLVSSGNVSVLFEIKVDLKKPCTAFAFIEDISFHPEEKEVLFSIGSSFMVDDVTGPNDDETYHTIHMTASDIDKAFLHDVRAKVKDCSASSLAVMLARYLIELGEFRAARKYLNSLLFNVETRRIALENDPSLAALYNCLGMTFARQNLHGDALKAFKQALNTQARLEFSNNNAMAEIYNNIGLAFIGLGHMEEAEATFAKAERIQMREPRATQEHLAAIYGNIAYVYYKKNNPDYDKSKLFFEKSRLTYDKIAGKFTQDTLERQLAKAECYTNYGHLLCVHPQIAINQARKLYEEALKIYTEILTDDDPKLMRAHVNIMLAYARNESYNEFIEYYQRNLVKSIIDNQSKTMFELNCTITQATLTSLHDIIGTCYAFAHQYSQAINVWTDAFVFETKSELENFLFGATARMTNDMQTFPQRIIDRALQTVFQHYLSSSIEETNESNQEENQQNTILPRDFCCGIVCFKLYMYKEAMDYFNRVLEEQTSINRINMLSHLLIGKILTSWGELDKAQESYTEAMKLITASQNNSNKDEALEIAVALSKIGCYSDSDDLNRAIDELHELKRSIRINEADFKRISLKCIVYDHLAMKYLKKKQYDLCYEYAAQKSMKLKTRYLSQYHPSLANNFLLLADSCVRQNQYVEALNYFNQALDILRLNLTLNHPAIKTIYYSMGDCYCQMDKLNEAKKMYNIATEDSDEVDDLDKTVIARIKMYLHLGLLFARQKAYGRAVDQLRSGYDLTCEYSYRSDKFTWLPPEILFVHIPGIIERLHKLVQYYEHRSNNLAFMDDPKSGYQYNATLALNIHRMLVLDKTTDERKIDKLVSSYYKMGQIYETLDRKQEAIEYYQKGIDQQAHIKTTPVSILYRMGCLHALCDDQNQAMRFQKLALDQLLTDESKNPLLKIIVQKKVDSIAPSLDEQMPLETGDEESSPKTEKNESYLRSLALAYLEFDDRASALECYENDIKFRSQALTDRSLLNNLPSLEIIAYDDYQEVFLPLISKYFQTLAEQCIQLLLVDNFNDILLLVDSYSKLGEIRVANALQTKALNRANSMTSYKKAIQAQAIVIYMCATVDIKPAQQWMIDVTGLLDKMIALNLAPTDLIEAYSKLSKSDQIEMHMKLAALYRVGSIQFDENLDCNKESQVKAIEHYQIAIRLSDKNFEICTLCYFHILFFYKISSTTDFSEDFVQDVLEWMQQLRQDALAEQPQLTTKDRFELAFLAKNVLDEYFDKHGVVNTELDDMQPFSSNDDDDNNVSVTDVKIPPTIGERLHALGDLAGAVLYWDIVIGRVDSIFSSHAIELMILPNSTLNQIVQTTVVCVKQYSELYTLEEAIIAALDDSETHIVEMDKETQ